MLVNNLKKLYSREHAMYHCTLYIITGDGGDRCGETRETEGREAGGGGRETGGEGREARGGGGGGGASGGGGVRENSGGEEFSNVSGDPVGRSGGPLKRFEHTMQIL